MNKLWVLIKYNFKHTAIKKSFIVITILGPVLIIMMATLPGIITERAFSGKDAKIEIAVYGGSENFYEIFIKNSSDFMEAYRVYDLEAARNKCFTGEIDGLLLIPDDVLASGGLDLYSSSGSKLIMMGAVRNSISKTLTWLRAVDENIDPEKVERITAAPEINIIEFNKDGSDKKGSDFSDYIYIAIAFIMLLYMTTLIYSQMIGRSVLNEKTGKTVEIMLSSVRPATLMAGKIAGIGIAGILQYAIWIVSSLIFIKIVGPHFNLKLPKLLSTGILVYLIVFFLLAFFLYSSIYAACGALASDEQSYGQIQIPFIIPLIVPLTIVSYLVINPDSPVTVFMSLFPLTAPMTMFIRILVSSPGLIQIVLCIVIMLASISAAAIGSGRIFTRTILNTGKNLKLMDGLRIIFVKKEDRY